MPARPLRLVLLTLLTASCGVTDFEDVEDEQARGAFKTELPALLSPADRALPYDLKAVVAFEVREAGKSGDPKRYWLDFHGLTSAHQRDAAVKLEVRPCWLRWRSESLDGELISRKTFDLRDAQGTLRFKGISVDAELMTNDGGYKLVSAGPAAFLAGARLADPLDEGSELPVFQAAQPWQPKNPQITDEDGDGKPGVTGKGRIYLVAGFEIQGAAWGLVRSLEGKLDASSATGDSGTRVSGAIDLGGGLRGYGGSATSIGDVPEWIEKNILRYEIDTKTSFVMRPLGKMPQRCQDLQDFK